MTRREELDVAIEAYANAAAARAVVRPVEAADRQAYLEVEKLYTGCRAVVAQLLGELFGERSAR